MKKVVWKYSISLPPDEDDFSFQMPTGYKILTAQVQKQGDKGYEKEVLALWALVNPDEKVMETVQFRLAGTGHPIDMEKYPLGIEYINSFQMENGKLVFHLFFVETNSTRAMMKAFKW